MSTENNYTARFKAGKNTVNGYYSIEDAHKEDATIWIDCSEEQLHVCINALNEHKFKQTYGATNTQPIDEKILTGEDDGQ